MKQIFKNSVLFAAIAGLSLVLSSSVDCDGPSDRHCYPSPDNCQDFYMCAHGIAILHQCPAGLEFDPLREICDWPGNCGRATCKSTKRCPDGITTLECTGSRCNCRTGYYEVICDDITSTC
jgi:hypothetical protein